MTSAGEDAPEPQPGGPGPQPGGPGAQPGGPGAQPVDPGAQPVDPGAQPPPFGRSPFDPPPFEASPYARPPQASIPGWLWAATIATALVTGLVGGLLGGVLVLGARSLSDGVLPEIGRESPLEEDNQSVAAVAAEVLPSTVQVRVVNGGGDKATGASGSGFVVDGRGHVITNNHVVAVVEPRGTIDVVDVSGRSREATVVGVSPVYDIAVLRVKDRSGLVPAALGSSRRLQVGQAVVAIGSPLGLSSTVTSGIISALDRPVTTSSAPAPGSAPAAAASYINAVQTDAAINPGNSGGPLVNMSGQVVGVNSAIATAGGGLLGGSNGNIGVGFAIPMEQVRFTASQILETGRAEYPVIGANVGTADSVNGATVVEVPKGTPADEAGLRKGDRIVAVDRKRVVDGIALIVAIRTHRPGETIDLTVVRGERERTVQITLDAKVG